MVDRFLREDDIDEDLMLSLIADGLITPRNEDEHTRYMKFARQIQKKIEGYAEKGTDLQKGFASRILGHILGKK